MPSLSISRGPSWHRPSHFVSPVYLTHHLLGCKAARRYLALSAEATPRHPHTPPPRAHSHWLLPCGPCPFAPAGAPTALRARAGGSEMLGREVQLFEGRQVPRAPFLAVSEPWRRVPSLCPPRPSSAPSRHRATGRWHAALLHPQKPLPKPCVTPLIYRPVKRPQHVLHGGAVEILAHKYRHPRYSTVRTPRTPALALPGAHATNRSTDPAEPALIKAIPSPIPSFSREKKKVRSPSMNEEYTTTRTTFTHIPTLASHLDPATTDDKRLIHLTREESVSPARDPPPSRYL